ncbi:MAG: glycoside hydrolase family 26 protein [Patescibacteria group bacterium]
MKNISKLLKNKRFQIFILIVTTILAVLSSISILNPFYPTPKEEIKFGLYTENEEQYALSNVTYKHYFSVWGEKFENQNQSFFDKINKINKQAIITLEPWPIYGENSNRELFLNNIVDGKYNKLMTDYCISIEKNINDLIYLRMGHEMELHKTSRYPWAINNPELFKKAYKHLINQCRTVTKKAKYVWSPAGNEGLANYYPGDEYVDYVGLSWYSYAAYEWYTFNKIYSFKEIMDDKYNRVKQFKKPIMIAEFGIAGPKDKKEKVYQELLKKSELKDEYPLLHSIIYFNDKTESWVIKDGKNIIEEPDWLLTTEELSKL